MKPKNTNRRIFNRIGFASLSVALVASAGCNLCCPPYLDDYATVGGKWARANPTEGRVGSAFSDPGVIGVSAETPMFPHAEFNNPDLEAAPPTNPEFPLSDAPMTLGDDW